MHNFFSNFKNFIYLFIYLFIYFSYAFVYASSFSGRSAMNIEERTINTELRINLIFYSVGENSVTRAWNASVSVWR